MTSRDFAFWLQGFIEINQPQTINKEQTQVIKNHLNLVFKHEIDPSMGDDKHQAELNAIHKPNSIVPNNKPNSKFPSVHDGLLRC
jgi:hypothetical protein